MPLSFLSPTVLQIQAIIVWPSIVNDFDIIRFRVILFCTRYMPMFSLQLFRPIIFVIKDALKPLLWIKACEDHHGSIFGTVVGPC